MLYKAFNWLLNNGKYVVALLLMGVSFYVGWFMCQKYDANVVVKTEVQTVEVEKVVPVEVPVEVKGDTIIKYVEKQTPSDSDVQIDSTPKIAVEYNGQTTEIEGVKGETQKFEKGKLTVEQTTKATLDVTPIVEKEVNSAVAKAVQDNTNTLNESHEKELKEERHKRHKRELQSFLAGAGVGLLAVAF